MRALRLIAERQLVLEELPEPSAPGPGEVRVRIRAVSHSGQFDRRANLMQAAADAMEEAIDQKAAVSFPPTCEQPDAQCRS